MKRSFILLVFSVSAVAENSWVAAAYNQARFGRWCREVTPKEAESVGKSCNIYEGQTLHYAAWRSFNRKVFDAAAQKQLPKNECLIERVNLLKQGSADKQIRGMWLTRVAKAWLGSKKAELMYRRCDHQVISRVQAEDVKRLGGLREAYDATKKRDKELLNVLDDLTDKELDTCTDKKELGALASAHSLMQYTIPMVSGPEMIEAMDEARSMIVVKSTGKPVTDKELLHANLCDERITKDCPATEPGALKLSDLKFNILPMHNVIIDKALDGVASKRRELNGKISDSLNSNLELDTDIKDFLFKEEAVQDVLVEGGYLKKEYSNLDAANQEEVSRGAFCLMAQYETTFTGEMLAFATESVVYGAVLFKLWRAFGWVKEGMSIKQKLGKGATLGLTIGGIPMVAEQIRKSCPIPLVGSDEHKMGKYVDREKSELNASVNGGIYLPQDIGYHRGYIVLPKEKTPSCTNERSSDIFKSTDSPNCLVDALLGVISIL